MMHKALVEEVNGGETGFPSHSHPVFGRDALMNWLCVIFRYEASCRLGCLGRGRMFAGVPCRGKFSHGANMHFFCR